MFFETLAEIEAEVFATAQLPPEKGLFGPNHGGSGDDSPRGMHIIAPLAKRTRMKDIDPKRIAAKREHARLKDLARIRDALLRGERPKRSDCVRWRQVAAELGIDLTAPMPKATQ